MAPLVAAGIPVYVIRGNHEDDVPTTDLFRVDQFFQRRATRCPPTAPPAKWI